MRAPRTVRPRTFRELQRKNSVCPAQWYHTTENCVTYRGEISRVKEVPTMKARTGDGELGEMDCLDLRRRIGVRDPRYGESRELPALFRADRTTERRLDSLRGYGGGIGGNRRTPPLASVKSPNTTGAKRVRTRCFSSLRNGKESYGNRATVRIRVVRRPRNRRGSLRVGAVFHTVKGNR